MVIKQQKATLLDRDFLYSEEKGVSGQAPNREVLGESKGV
jgi:hypothetical protein